MKITTKWGEKIDKNNPLPEYPRPQFERDSFINLNGVWSYLISKKKTEIPTAFEGEIVVPFSPECQLSGVERVVMPDDFLYYEREFDLPEEFIKGRVILNFGAVDYIAKVYVNGKYVGAHKGGYNPFSFDITDYIVIGKNRINVTVTDPSNTGDQCRGKQTLNGTGIWYTPQSGIWQTVWLESTPLTFIEKIKITPDIDEKAVKIVVSTNKAPESKAEIVVVDGDNVVANVNFESGKEVVIPIEDMKLWSPEDPHLYDVVVVCDDDMVRSYFGMRKFSEGVDKTGKKRLFLNNKPYFHKGLLDQGYWSDGMLTPPSDEAMIYDIQTMKDLGFNMLRKHIKVEPMRWYYHCDRLGMIVWQDMVSGCKNYNILCIAVLPFLGFMFNDNKYGFFHRKNKEARDEYTQQYFEMLDNLYNVVSIGMWVPFNEGWGQFDSAWFSERTKEFDATRTVDSASGWHDQGIDAKSIHCYFTPFKVPKKEKRLVLLSEYGGYSYQEKGHVFNNKKFGYRIYNDKESLNAAYKKLHEKLIIPAIKDGLAATVYTQVSDVESEITGLLTYDRRVLKVDPDMVRAVNAQLKL